MRYIAFNLLYLLKFNNRPPRLNILQLIFIMLNKKDEDEERRNFKTFDTLLPIFVSLRVYICDYLH